MLSKKLKCHIVCLVLYLTSTFGNTYMLFPYLPILFFNRKLFHNLSDFSLRIWFGLAVFFLEKFCSIRIFMHESKNDKGKKFTESSIVLMNHRTRLDWLFYFCILYRYNALTKIKIILKDALKKVPGPGWAMQTALFIFIKRQWQTDRDILTKFIQYFKLIEKNTMILIFPEGTNLTAETIKRSDKFASENNLKPLTQVLYPRTTGFIHIFNEMSRLKTIDSIYDVTVAYRGGKIPENELDFLNGNLPDEIHFFTEKFDSNSLFKKIDINENVNDLSKDLSENKKKLLEEWVNERWIIKEEFLRCFYESETNIESKTSFEKFQSTFDTINPNQFDSNYLVLYPIYWLLSSILIVYLMFNYFLFKLFIFSAFLFYVCLQIFGNGLDDLIMNFNNKKLL